MAVPYRALSPSRTPCRNRPFQRFRSVGAAGGDDLADGRVELPVLEGGQAVLAMRRHSLGFPRKRERETRSIRFSPRIDLAPYEWQHAIDQAKGINPYAGCAIDEMMDRGWTWSSCFLPTTCAVKGAVAEARRRPKRAQAPRAGPAERVISGPGWRWAGVPQDGAGQVCRPYLSVTAAATNFLRPALPGLVPWAAHQSGNVAGSM